ncbi:hypothetical protein BO78DRAFT_413669 [Aspergillus sclerotiicarbonarius CBS 121057]|uniref:Uncharacterized protein n=1 Tax=Aspergillus sclerotiicarbonarius (strain CBS 121057 / IBT 28362) TaxID=1448318 RepID=A0A319ENG3_ASPSB|nr:hypothetical protein BO78DRAFT_413669 [Aspergillus sclerotiicarbonarius CBS 121057]
MARKAGRPPTRLQGTKRSSASRRAGSNNQEEQRHQQQQQPSPASLGGSEDLHEIDSTLGTTECAPTNFEAMFLNAATDDTETSLSLFSTMPTIPGLEMWGDVDMSRMCDADASHPLPTDSDDQEMNMMMMMMMDQPDFGDSPLSAIESNQSGTGTKPIEWEPSAPPIAGNAMQQLCALSGKLAGQVQSLAPVDSSPIDKPMSRLEQLAAHGSDGLDPLSSDTATILQILAVYIRLTQLHHALYRQMKSVLTNSGDCPLPFPSPSDLPFVLEICVHHLGEVETLLGLPAGFCVSEQMVENGGILHQSAGGMTLLVRTIMRQAENTVKGIRSVLAELAEETRGQIQV